MILYNNKEVYSSLINLHFAQRIKKILFHLLYSTGYLVHIIFIIMFFKNNIWVLKNKSQKSKNFIKFFFNTNKEYVMR